MTSLLAAFAAAVYNHRVSLARMINITIIAGVACVCVCVAHVCSSGALPKVTVLPQPLFPFCLVQRSTIFISEACLLTLEML